MAFQPVRGWVIGHGSSSTGARPTGSRCSCQELCRLLRFDAIEALRQFLVEVSSPVSERKPRTRGQACRRKADADGPPTESEWNMNLIYTEFTRRYQM